MPVPRIGAGLTVRRIFAPAAVVMRGPQVARLTMSMTSRAKTMLPTTA